MLKGNPDTPQTERDPRAPARIYPSIHPIDLVTAFFHPA